MPTIRIKEWFPPRSVGMFFPSKKYIAEIFDDNGKWLAETGKCATIRGARMAAHRKMGNLPL